MEYLLCVPYFGAGLLFWPAFRLFARQNSERQRGLRRVFVVTVAVLGALGLTFLGVAFAGRFNHNWLWATLWFPFINLISILCSLQVCISGRERII
jgi:hypothetical protein